MLNGKAALFASVVIAWTAVAGPTVVPSVSTHGGLVVVLDAGRDEALTTFAGEERSLVHGLVRESAAVAALNRRLLEAGFAGRVTVSLWDGVRIPFVSDTVNVVVTDGERMTDDTRRVLAPYGRVVDRRGETVWTKPVPEDTDEWTHYLHTPGNNAVGQDRRVAAPRRVKWLAGPLMSRHHDHLPSLSAMVTSRGRLFTIFDEAPSASILFPPEWNLIARDAFNGLVLWKRGIDEWHPHLWPLKSMPATLPRRLVAVDDDIFVTLGITAPVSHLRAADGREMRVLQGSDRCEEILVTDETVLALRLTGRGPLDDLVDDVRGKKLDPRVSKFPTVRRLMAGSMSPLWLHADRRLLAYDRRQGSVRWHHDGTFAPLSLASDGERVCFHDGKAIVALDAGTGKRLWTSEDVPVWDKFYSWYGASLVLYEDIVLFAGAEKMTSRPTGTPSGARDTMTAFSAADGRKLWTGEHLASGYRSPEDLFVAQGLVWAPDSTGRTKSVLKGLDPRTGKVMRELDIDFRQGFHHRCHAGRATENYLIASKVGVNMVDFGSGAMTQDNWIRGSCGYGIMPANGMIYATPDPCNCFPESKLDGFAAMAGPDEELAAARRMPEDSLEQGTNVSDDPVAHAQSSGEWPTYRGSAARSGSTDMSLPASLDVAWTRDIGGTLSAPVVAGGQVFVASVEQHAVMAVDAAAGHVVWTHSAGGRVDSPPTVVGRRLYFGSADGTVTSLNANNGDRQWRRRPAPRDERIVNDGRIESIWPVHGAVLHHNALIYAVAGRSMFVDGGLVMVALDPLTGEVVHEQNHHLSGEKTRGLGGRPAKPDILSASGTNVFMRSMTYGLECLPDSKSRAMHLFASNGFLNNTWFHRAFWTYGRNFSAGSAGFTSTGNKYYSGRTMVFDESHVYGFGRTRYAWGSAFEYKLYRAGRPPLIEPTGPKEKTKGAKSGALKAIDWAVDLPILARSMVKAGDRLFLAGPKRLYDETAAVQALETPEGRARIAAQAGTWGRSAELLVVSAADGSIEGITPLDCAPVWDGMAVAEACLFISGGDGSLRCLK